jgi:hypothetical protein
MSAGLMSYRYGAGSLAAAKVTFSFYPSIGYLEFFAFLFNG